MPLARYTTYVSHPDRADSRRPRTSRASGSSVSSWSATKMTRYVDWAMARITLTVNMCWNMRSVMMV